MLDKKFVDEYRKIKPTDDLKNRIFYSVLAAEEKPRKKPLYVLMRPVLSGALACVLLVCCLTVLPFDFLESGNMSVAYAKSGELIVPSSLESRVLTIAAYDDQYYEYDELPNGCVGAEFTFEFEGKTEVKTEYGSVYIKNADGSYEDIGQKTRIDGNVTLFWAMPAAEDSAKSVMTIKNRSGEWTLILERTEGKYKANLVTAE